MNKRQYIAKLANRLMEEGFAYDMSEAFKYAWAGESENYSFMINEKGVFVFDEK